ARRPAPLLRMTHPAPPLANSEASASEVATPGVGDSRVPCADVPLGSAEVAWFQAGWPSRGRRATNRGAQLLSGQGVNRLHCARHTHTSPPCPSHLPPWEPARGDVPLLIGTLTRAASSDHSWVPHRPQSTSC